MVSGIGVFYLGTGGEGLGIIDKKKATTRVASTNLEILE